MLNAVKARQLKLPLGHAEEEPVKGVATLAEIHRFLKGQGGLFPIARAVVGCPQGVPVVSVLRRQFGSFQKTD